MEDVARQCVRATGGVPLIVDGDTGYGGASNLRRTVRGFAAAGAAAISIEDQAFPKRCTFAAGTGVRVVDRDAAVARVRAALRARDEAKDAGHEVLVIARTDCRAALGLDEAIARCAAFDTLGADIVYGAFAACEYLHICSAIARHAIEQTSRRWRHRSHKHRRARRRTRRTSTSSLLLLCLVCVGGVSRRRADASLRADPVGRRPSRFLLSPGNQSKLLLSSST